MGWNRVGVQYHLVRDSLFFLLLKITDLTLTAYLEELQDILDRFRSLAKVFNDV